MDKWNASSGRMTHCLALLLLLLLVLPVRHVLCNTLGDGACNIRATLYVTSIELRQDQDFGLPLDIDCSNATSINSSTPSPGSFDLAAQRVAGKLHVLLNGSQTPPLGIASYGLEYLDNCLQLQSLQIERFVGDASLRLGCDSFGSQLKGMRSVMLRHNELGTLSGNSFELLPHLRQLHVEGNSLRLLEPLTGCEELQQLVIRRERQLVLRQVDLLKDLPQLRRLELMQLKELQAAILENLPGQLEDLSVRETPVQPYQLNIANGSGSLVNLTLVRCELTSFSLVGDLEETRLLHLNLSGNALRQLHVANTSLIDLDLSWNHLTSLNNSWFDHMPRLQQLHLEGNQLHRVSLEQLIQLTPLSLHQLDLSSNKLIRLVETETSSWDPTRQLRIAIDGNPWSCQWLLNFSHAQPELFRIFSYAKYISQINVNGLSCSPQLELDVVTSTAATVNRSQQLVNERNRLLNVSSHTVLYGNPMQQPHTQRSEALVIVFMLPLGIALLFLILYLYLHCERLFHWSYYSSGFGCFGGSKTTRQRFVDHIDIVRYPVPNGSTAVELDPEPDGYETPVSGAASICNCAGHRQSTCSRTHHVTYEAMPGELPYQLYAEIKDQDEGTPEAEQPLNEPTVPTAPIYDHLSYEEEQPLEV